MPSPRTYSFEAANRTDPTQAEQYSYSPYHDSPQRHITSPPPQYASPPPIDPPSPVAFSHSRQYSVHSTHDTRLSPTMSREPSPQRYTDRSPSPPPPPPPHRSSLSRYSQRNSIVRRPVGGDTNDIDDHVPQSHNAHPSQTAQLSLSEDLNHHSFDDGHERDTWQQNEQLQDRSLPSAGPYLQRPTSRLPERHPYASNVALAAGAATPGSITPGGTIGGPSSRYSGRSIPLEDYSSQYYNMSNYGYGDSPYHRSSHMFDPTISNASINPDAIVDDGDDNFGRASVKKPAIASQRQISPVQTGVIAAVGAPKAGGSGVLGRLFGRQQPRDRTSSGTYDPVDSPLEKKDFLARERQGRKRKGLIVGLAIGLVLIVIVIAGIVGGVFGSRAARSSGNNTNNADTDTAQNGDLDLNSPEIQALMNNPNLHKVFPGIDYTPWGVQYPLCETYPPSPNNVTRDLAVLSQLTNTVRLYGTDCNQTEMVLHSIDRLQLKNMKVWLGVWVDTNTTTLERQLSQMYKILAEVPDRSIFKGAIIGNEALYRAGEDKAQSKAELIQLLKDVKSNFTSLGYDLPVATSDLGDNWDGDLVQVVDYVMSNIHPFFAGVSAEEAASWTYNFWAQNDEPLTASLPNVKQIISETGWPSDGGTDCGGTTGDCTPGQAGSTASVDNMNTYMSAWVCQALANGTDYFWFEAFDEPWKVQFNTPGKDWEDKWGLMDAGRNLKSGVKIPDCGGQTVS